MCELALKAVAPQQYEAHFPPPSEEEEEEEEEGMDEEERERFVDGGWGVCLIFRLQLGLFWFIYLPTYVLAYTPHNLLDHNAPPPPPTD